MQVTVTGARGWGRDVTWAEGATAVQLGLLDGPLCLDQCFCVWDPGSPAVRDVDIGEISGPFQSAGKRGLRGLKIRSPG